MTDQLLRDTLTRMADRVEPAAPDLALWAQARRSRRRGDALTAAAVGVVVFALLAAVGVLARSDPTRTEPAPSGPGRPGIPTTVRGVDGDGGLDLAADLAVGRASVAVANPTGAFVVTAADGEYHRLDLPGFDAAAYDDPEVRAKGMVGLGLSPDGRRLAYGWHDALPEETGRRTGFVRSGVRILDLLTGRVETGADLGETPPEFAYAQRNQGFASVAVPFGLRWSADGRFLTYDMVWTQAGLNSSGDPYEPRGPRDAYRFARSHSAASVYDTASGERFGVNEFGQGLGWTGWPQMVSDKGLVATGGLVFAERDTRRRQRDVPGDSWTSGLFASGGRALVETMDPSERLAEVTLRTGAVRILRLDTGPARVELLGWIGRERALALVHPADGPDSWRADGDLVVLDLADTTVESTVVGRVEAAGTGSSFSFATDLATPRHPTRDFAERPESTPTRAGPTSSGADDAASGVDRRWVVAGLGAGVLAAALALLVLRRRIRTS